VGVLGRGQKSRLKRIEKLEEVIKPKRRYETQE
jgi:hypothetical protein